MDTSPIVIGLAITAMLTLSGCRTTTGGGTASQRSSTNPIILTSGAEESTSEPSLSLLNHDDYLYAVAAIDRFLNDWLNNDSKNGIALLTPHAKSGRTLDELRAYFSTTSSPHHEGYEVVGYKEESPARFESHVWRYGYAMGLYGSGASWSRPRPQTVSVVQQHGSWYVNNLSGD